MSGSCEALATIVLNPVPHSWIKRLISAVNGKSKLKPPISKESKLRIEISQPAENWTTVVPSPNKEGIPYYTLTQLSQRTGYHPVYLRRLLLDGKLDGIKVQLGGGEPGFWVTTEAAIRDYEGRKDKRGRPKAGNRKR
jgi:hypothetical protein